LRSGSGLRSGGGGGVQDDGAELNAEVEVDDGLVENRENRGQATGFPVFTGHHDAPCASATMKSKAFPQWLLLLCMPQRGRAA